MIEGKIISGFPGIGKSYLYTTEDNITITDSDSSKFSWISEGVRNPEFPDNYIKHILSAVCEHDIVLISSHKEIRDILSANNIIYEIYYPSEEDMDIYINRYKLRGNPDSFINLVRNNWNNWISEIDNDPFPIKHKLNGNVFLKDYVK